MAMSQKPVPPVNIPIPAKIGSKMGGEFTYQPKWDPTGFDNHSHVSLRECTRTPEPQSKPVLKWSTQNHVSRIKKADGPLLTFSPKNSQRNHLPQEPGGSPHSYSPSTRVLSTWLTKNNTPQREKVRQGLRKATPRARCRWLRRAPRPSPALRTSDADSRGSRSATRRGFGV